MFVNNFIDMWYIAEYLIKKFVVESVNKLRGITQNVCE